MEEFQSILYDEWTSIEELVEGEDWKCKWGLLGLHMIASEFCKLGDQHGTGKEERDWKELEVLDTVERIRSGSMLSI
jgi:hypothetical protein